MARTLRIEYPGAIYHVLNRGDHGEDIFRDDQDRELFLAALGEACQETGWQVHAFCLMSNHFHLVVETPEANLVSGMRWFDKGKEFRRELLEQIFEQRGEWHYGHELIESAEAKAEGIIRQALTRKGWAEKDLNSRRKGDPFKVALAAKLRGQTTVTVGWIAEHLSMGTRGHLAHLLHQWTREQGKQHRSR